jgi:hypothetical protein
MAHRLRIIGPLLILAVNSVLISSMSNPVQAQTVGATLRGTVHDQQGAVLAGTSVTLLSPALGTQRISTTDSRGVYQFALLPPGIYELRVEHQGFASKGIQEIHLQVDQELEIDIPLQIAATTEKVDVTASTPTVDSRRSDLNGIVSQEAIYDLPLEGRQFTNLVQLMPGVAPGRGAETQGSNFNVFGSRGFSNRFLIDNADNTNTYTGDYLQDFNEDAIQEFEVLLNGFQAEYGRSSGAILNIVTKSGTNALHGSAFSYFRNDVLSSSNVSGQPVPPLTHYETGGVIGGPIIKNKTFFFGSVQDLLENRGANFNLATIPPAVMNGVMTPPGLTENFGVLPDTSNFTGLAKITQQFGENHQAVLSANYTPHYFTSFPFIRGYNVLPSTLDSTKNAGVSTTLWTSHRLSATKFLQTTTTFANTRIGQNLDRSTIQNGGIPEGITAFFPQGPFQAGATDSFLQINDRQSKRIGGSVNMSSLVANWGGEHEITFGGAIDRFTTTGYNQGAIRIGYSNVAVNGHGFSFYHDAFRNWPVSFRPDGSFNVDIKNTSVGPFLQDSWRPRAGLTIDAGLRYDWDSLLGSATKNVSPRLGVAWDPRKDNKTVIRASWGMFYDASPTSSAQSVPALGGTSAALATDIILPDLGALYQGDRTAGFLFNQGGATKALMQLINPTYGGQTAALYNILGIPLSNPADPYSYPVVMYNNIQQLSGLTPDAAIAKIYAAVPALSGKLGWDLASGFPVGVEGRPLAFIFSFPTAASLIETFDPNIGAAHTYALNLGIEREVVRNLSVDVQYIRRTSRDLMAKRVINLNPGPPGSPGFGSTTDGGPKNLQTGDTGRADYDGLAVVVKRRFQGRFFFMASYTYSHALDNLQLSSLGQLPSYTDSRNPNLDYGKSNNALDHMFVANGSVHLPLNFTVAAVWRLYSGQPYSAAGNIDSDGDGNIDPRDYTTVRNGYSMRPYQALDTHVQKDFPFKDRYRLSIIGDVFNLLNRQNVLAVVTNNQTAQFGQPTAYSPGREGQLAIRFSF